VEVTKQLVSISKKNNKLGDKRKFQIVLVDYDRSAKKLEGYLKKINISWPAIKLEQMESLGELTSIGEATMPHIVLLKPDGTVVSDKRDNVIKKLEELVES